MQKIISIPEEVQKYFWDVDASKVDGKTHRNYVISRILEHGDQQAARWLLRAYPKKDVVDVLKKSRALSAKSGMFWASFFRVPFSNLLCLKTSFRQLQRSHWSA